MILFIFFTTGFVFAQDSVEINKELKPVKASVTVVVEQLSGAKSSESRFCCKNENNRACYVFGDASCTNCTAFCSGSMVVQGLDFFEE